MALAWEGMRMPRWFVRLGIWTVIGGMVLSAGWWVARRPASLRDGYCESVDSGQCRAGDWLNMGKIVRSTPWEAGEILSRACDWDRHTVAQQMAEVCRYRGSLRVRY